MDRSDRGTSGKPTRLGYAWRRYAEVSNLLLTGSTECIDVTGPTSLLRRTKFSRIESACLSSSINADPKLALPRKKSPRRPTAWLGSTRSYTERRAWQEGGWLTSKGKWGSRRRIDHASDRGQRRTCGSCGCFMGCLRPSRWIRNRRPIIRSAMRSPPMTGNLYPYNSKLRPPPLWIDEASLRSPRRCRQPIAACPMMQTNDWN